MWENSLFLEAQCCQPRVPQNPAPICRVQSALSVPGALFQFNLAKGGLKFRRMQQANNCFESRHRRQWTTSVGRKILRQTEWHFSAREESPRIVLHCEQYTWCTCFGGVLLCECDKVWKFGWAETVCWCHIMGWVYTNKIIYLIYFFSIELLLFKMQKISKNK